MSAPLRLDEKAVPAEAFLRAWLKPVVTTTPTDKGIGSALWNSDMPLPYRAVRRIAGPRTPYSDEPLMRVHSFGKDYPAASLEGMKTDDRILVLVDYPGWATTVGGLTVHCDWVEITEAARHEPYGSENVVERFITELRLGLSLVRA